MDILDQIREQQTVAENVGLAAAQHNANWAQTFNSIPSAEKLRAQKNLADQVASAMERRRALAAETDLKSQSLYYNAKKFEQDQEMEPLRKDLLDAQVEHERASTGAIGLAQRTKQADEIADLNDLQAFTQEIADIEAPLGSPEYISALNKAAVKRTRALTTPAGRELFETKSKRHQSIADVQSQIPEGHEIKSISFTDNGVQIQTSPLPTARPMSDYQRESLKQRQELRQQARTRIPESAANRFAKLQGELATLQGDAERERQSNMKANKPDARFSDDTKLAGVMTERDNLLKRYPSLAGTETAPGTAPVRLTFKDGKLVPVQ